MPPAAQPGRPLKVVLADLGIGAPNGGKSLFDAVLRAGCRALTAGGEPDAFVAVIGIAPPDPEDVTRAADAYQRAVKQKLPRLVFVATGAPAWDGTAGAFRSQLQAENTCAPYASQAELSALVTRELWALRGSATEGAGEPHAAGAVPRPPEFYTAPPYLLQGAKFVGRRAELLALDEWATARDPFLVVEAIGGMGKSALTWEWAQRSAPAAIPKLAGRMWWSFYERGTSMKMFLQHALAYVTGYPLSRFEGTSSRMLGDDLLFELRAKPHLMVLDGFERVLTAYHRSNKAQLRDDLVPIDERECTNPRDGEVLRHLLQCAPSKFLISTRLMPAALQSHRSGRVLPGVRHIVLAGLAPVDAVGMARAAHVRGSEERFLDFADQFDRHPLLLRVACGLVADYPPRPGDFDAWITDPAAGGRLRLTDLVAKQRYTQLLEYAFRALNPPTRQLLSRIAVLSDSADYATVAVLNPYLPPPPDPVADPGDFARSWFVQDLDARRAAETDPDRRAALDNRRARELAAHERRRRVFQQYLDAVRDYPRSTAYRQGMADFHAGLSELENRGLLQWDRDANTYDMHPVVRAYAFELLEEGDRTQAFNLIGNYFASQRSDDPVRATDLSHLKNSVEIVRAFTGAGRTWEAARFLRGSLSEALLFTVGAHHTLIELLTPLLAADRTGWPHEQEARERSYLMNNLALALSSVGRVTEAKSLYTNAAWLDLESGDLFNLETALRSLARCLQKANELHLAARVLEHAGTLAATTQDQQGITAGLFDRLALSATLGRLDDAEALFAGFHTRPVLPHHMYRPGAAEYHLALAQFYGGKLRASDLLYGDRLASDGRGVQNQHLFAALRAEWELKRGNPSAALQAAESALSVVRRTGEAATDYLGLRAHALARLGRADEALETLAEAVRGWDGRLPRFPFHAAEAYLALGDREEAGAQLARAYRCAWADGPPYSHWYYLGALRERLMRVGAPEPLLPAFDPAVAALVPFERELTQAIANAAERRRK